MILVQLAFGGGTMQKDIDWEEMALLPKGKGDYWGVGIAEVLWKVCAVVVNCCLKRSAVLHDALHWFIEGKGTGTANLEAKMSQHLVGLAHKPLFLLPITYMTSPPQSPQIHLSVHTIALVLFRLALSPILRNIATVTFNAS